MSLGVGGVGGPLHMARQHSQSETSLIMNRPMQPGPSHFNQTPNGSNGWVHGGSTNGHSANGVGMHANTSTRSLGGSEGGFERSAPMGRNISDRDRHGPASLTATAMNGRTLSTGRGGGQGGSRNGMNRNPWSYGPGVGQSGTTNLSSTSLKPLSLTGLSGGVGVGPSGFATGMGNLPMDRRRSGSIAGSTTGSISNGGGSGTRTPLDETCSIAVSRNL